MNFFSHKAVLQNINYFLRFWFWFRLLKSYSSGSDSDYWKVMVPIPIAVPTIEKSQFRLGFWLSIQVIKSSFQQQKSFLHNLAFLM